MFFNETRDAKKKSISFIKDNHGLLNELKEKGIFSKNILDSIKKVPRELFVNKTSIQLAYENIALPADCGQTISQPYVIAYMIDCLKLKKTDVVLEIGTGTGYQTAIISYLCKKIYTIEMFSKLFNKAKFNIEKLKIKNVIHILGNGVRGWKEKEFFDAIIISAASKKIPLPLLQNLKIKGKLIYPKKYPLLNNQKLILLKKKDENNFEENKLFDVKFVPLLKRNTENYE